MLILFWDFSLSQGNSELFQWGKIEKVVNQAKLAILSDPEPLQWEKIGKIANEAKLAIPSDSEPLWWEKIGKVANQAKLVVLSHSEQVQWEKIVKTGALKKEFVEINALYITVTSILCISDILSHIKELILQ